MLTILTSNTLTEACVFVIIVLIEIVNNIMEDEEHAIFDCPEYNT